MVPPESRIRDTRGPPAYLGKEEEEGEEVSPGRRMILTGARRPVRVPEGRLVRSGLESGLEPGGGVGGDERNEQGALVDWFGPLISVPFLVWLSGSLRLCGIPGPIFILHYLTIIPFLPLLPFFLRLPFPFSLIFVAKALLQYRLTPPVDEVFMSYPLSPHSYSNRAYTYTMNDSERKSDPITV
jgi:hypothetical protein